LKLGSRVHEIGEIEDVVQTDITIKTSIIESRFIYGSKILWYGFQSALSSVQKFGQKEFVLEKLQEHKERLLKYPLRMEPNIKDGYGGMRESNMLFWMANITYGVNSSKELAGVVFTDSEYKSYRSALEYVFRIRNALHLIAKKKLDSVNFDVLPELSSKLGFKDTPKLVKERQCMSKLFASLHTIHYFSSVMVKKISRQYLYDSKNIAKLKKSRIAKNLYLNDGVLYTSYNRTAISLFELLKELNSLPMTINKFESSYVYFANKTILPNNLSEKVKQQIRDLLSRENLYPIMKLLYNAGLFKVVIPSGKKILNQPQFDGFHVHPVDIHTLKTLYHCHNIQDEFIANNYKQLAKEDKSLLNVMALFHDVGKGRTKDHHIVGQELFKKFAVSIGMKEEDIVVGGKIIRYHNIMSMVATSEDIYSQKVILNFTALLGSKRALDILMCHTYGDINSVGKGVYKSSTANLIKELYLQSVHSFENTELLKTSARRVAKENTIKNNKIFKQLPRNIQRKILSIDSNQLFLMYKASDIVELGIKAKDVMTFEYEIINETYLTIKILKLDQLNLGYLLGKLSFLDISSMGIFRLYDDKKYFKITFSEKLDEVDLPFIEEIINNSFDMEKQFKHKKPVILRKEIEIDCDHRDDLAQVKIHAKDQKGLFAYIAKIFDDFNIEIESAKIYSSHGRVNDLLLIEKNGNFCKNQEEILRLITE
jgi:[protein-PII] uridylyltransferase